MARHLGISVSTVSRCLNNYPDVNSDTRQRVLDAIKELNYTPNAAARNITKKDARTIGLTIPDIQDSFFAANADAVEEVCRSNGYNIIYGSLARKSERLVEFLKRSVEMRLDGVIITPDVWDSELLHTLDRIDMPIVLLRRRPPPGVDLPYVDTDHYSGAKKITEYLLSLGHTKIGHVTLPTEIGQERLNGYRDAMRESGLDTTVVSAPSPSGRLLDSMRNGRDAMSGLMEKAPDITAVFAASDLLAMGVMEHCASHGIRVPEDLSLAGFDNLEYAEFYWFQFTTMSLDRWESGVRAAKMLLRMIRGQVKTPQSILLEAKLVVRNSTRARE